MRIRLFPFTQPGKSGLVFTREVVTDEVLAGFVGKPGLEDVCTCGHRRREHFGVRGPCLMAHPSAPASVCACSKFELKAGGR